VNLLRGDVLSEAPQDVFIMKRLSNFAAIAIFLLAAFALLAQGSTSVFQGAFTAQVGKSQVFRGRWTAAVATQNLNFAQGYWTLLNDFHQVSLEGSWTLNKTGARWHGSWSARVQNGASISGTWDADISGEKDATLAGMLRRTIEREVAGSWSSGRFAGFWWLDGEKPKPHTP
jgi:hypothetical protein